MLPEHKKIRVKTKINGTVCQKLSFVRQLRTGLTKYNPKKTIASPSMTSQVLNYFPLGVVIMLEIAQADEHIFIRFCVSTLVHVVKSRNAVNMNFLYFFMAPETKHLHVNCHPCLIFENSLDSGP